MSKRLLLVLVVGSVVGVSVGHSVFAGVIHDENFDGDNGGYTVTDDGFPESPWQWDSGSGTWLTTGSENLGQPSHSRLTSPAVVITESGLLELTFLHRYSIEGDLWDGGAVFISVNGGEFNQLLTDAFSAGGYTGFGLIGNHDLNGDDGYNGDSPGYGDGTFITSVASLGTFSVGDTVAVQFLAAWDESVKGQEPNWQITAVTIAQVPEPSVLALAAIGGFGVGVLMLRRKSTRY
ncbi:MAG: PEP-CTERM sorting domain-containing protein [Pirellulaceae bacterium]|jgi:hypothetical protein|nr:PEP-CTERM sorting domain-containing protein [Pirellulaceae bacterium]